MRIDFDEHKFQSLADFVDEQGDYIKKLDQLCEIYLGLIGAGSGEIEQGFLTGEDFISYINTLDEEKIKGLKNSLVKQLLDIMSSVFKDISQYSTSYKSSKYTFVPEDDLIGYINVIIEQIRLIDNRLEK